MDYYWIPIVFLLLVAIFSDTNSCSPFASEQVKAICAHMTAAERGAAIRRAPLWGLLIGLIPGMIGAILGVVAFRSATVGVTFCFLVLPLVALLLYKKWWPQAVKSQQNFLASTAWARSQGIKAQEIHLYKWH